MEDLSFLKDKEPLEIFKTWLQEAEEHSEIDQANAMVLSSCHSTSKHTFKILGFNFSKQKFRVSSRVVLLKGIQEENLLFYSNYTSLKSDQLSKNPSALNFYWPALGKQIRLEGTTRLTHRSQSTQYWKTRPWESQVSQYISQQSAKLENRKILEKKWEEAQRKFYGKEVPCPHHWGGFAFQPHLIEFWRERPHRLHDRLVFAKKSSFRSKKQWKSYLLYP